MLDSELATGFIRKPLAQNTQFDTSKLPELGTKKSNNGFNYTPSPSGFGVSGVVDKVNFKAGFTSSQIGGTTLNL
ncbi:MAG: hypothetical protein ACOYN2_05135 [Patescibacteria group bacterium]